MKKINLLLLTALLINQANNFTMQENKSDFAQKTKKRKLNYELINAISNKKSTNVIKSIIQKEPDLNMLDSIGRTLLITALDCNNIDAFLILKNKNIDIKAKDNLGRTALMESFKRAPLDIIKDLINNSNINEKDNEGANVLMYAFKYGNRQIVDLLVASGAIIKFSKEELEIAKKNNYLDTIRAFLLGHAIKTGNILAVKYYIKNKLPLDIVLDEENNTPLHIASYYRQNDIFKLILSQNPDLITKLNNNSQNPISINPGILVGTFIPYLN